MFSSFSLLYDSLQGKALINGVIYIWRYFYEVSKLSESIYYQNQYDCDEKISDLLVSHLTVEL